MKRIPSPRCFPVIGTVLSIVAAGGAPKLHLYVDKRHRELGPIYKEKLGSISAVFIADGNYMRKIFSLEGKHPRHLIPEAWLLYNEMRECKRGLLFMEGEEWLKYRKIMNNILLKIPQNKFCQAAATAADYLIDDLPKGGQVIQDLEKQLYKWSLEVIVAALLGNNNYAREKTNLFSMINDLAQSVHKIFIESASLSLIPAKIAMKFRLPVWKRFESAATKTINQGKNITEKLLEEVRNGNIEDEGLLAEILSADICEENVKRIVIDLILAAGDTTAHTMEWILHLISTDLHRQEKIYEEIKEKQTEEVLHCPLLKGCLKEALRLYPVAPFITRFMPEDCILDDYKIKANDMVLMSLYSSGRNPQYFPQPNVFIPERWMRRNTQGYEGVINSNASLPFALGSRSCVGKKLAETQILVALSKILQKYEVTSPEGKKIDPVLHLITVPSEPVKIMLNPRKHILLKSSR